MRQLQIRKERRTSGEAEDDALHLGVDFKADDGETED